MGSGVAVQRNAYRPQDASVVEVQRQEHAVAAPVNATAELQEQSPAPVSASTASSAALAPLSPVQQGKTAADEVLLFKEGKGKGGYDDDSCSSTSSESDGASKSDELPLVAQWFKQLYEKEKQEKERLSQECRAKDDEICKLRARLNDGIVLQPVESDSNSPRGGFPALGMRHQAPRQAPRLQACRSADQVSKEQPKNEQDPKPVLLPIGKTTGVSFKESPKNEDDSKLVLPPIGKTTDMLFKSQSFLEAGPSIRQRRMSDPGLSSHAPVSTLNVCTPKLSSLKDEPLGPKRRRSSCSTVW
eukprot:TRINITY_DN71984_c0_g1_i1.p1 TRINITY_DN71984_c0_g1~~TRINITY_DN71984_c0_g1_i1.p1  ORF type:complete len:311 (-),score=63.88 TRINITY_DN71984_c0_g1_i1:126-1028(-)